MQSVGRRWQEEFVAGESTFYKPLKPFARGNAGRFRCLRCEYSCAYLTTPSAHEAAGALGTRHSPRPLFKGRRISDKPRAQARRENANVCPVIARRVSSEAI